MARIRTIKPEFWTSEQIVECSLPARLLFIGLWNFCDDGGIHPASVRRLKMEVFPADDFTASELSCLINELLENGLLRLYEVSGMPYWIVTGWKHQKIDKPTYKHPNPEESDAEILNSKPGSRDLDDSSTSPRRLDFKPGSQDIDDTSASPPRDLDDTSASPPRDLDESSATTPRDLDESSVNIPENSTSNTLLKASKGVFDETSTTPHRVVADTLTSPPRDLEEPSGTEGSLKESKGRDKRLSGSGEPEAKQSAQQKAKSQPKRKTAFPDGFLVSGPLRELVTKNGWPNPDQQVEQFRDYHLKHGSRFVDWEAAFRTWMRKAKEFQAQSLTVDNIVETCFVCGQRGQFGHMNKPLCRTHWEEAMNK
jgi:hypothetical protein